MAPMTEEKKKRIKKVWDKLIDGVNPDDLINKLFAREVISAGEMGEIKSEKTRRRVNTSLLTLIIENKSEEAFDIFVNSLDDTEQNHWADLIRTPGQSTSAVVHPNTASGSASNNLPLPANSILKVKIKSNYSKIVSQVDPLGAIFDDMFSGNVLSREKVQQINLKPLAPDRCRELLDLLLATSHPTACELFVSTLLKGQHQYLAQEVLNG